MNIIIFSYQNQKVSEQNERKGHLSSFARAQDDSRILPVRSMWKADRERSFPFVSLRASAHALRMTAGLKFTPMGAIIIG